ncbi:MAG: hypothetical protein B7Z47_05530, partial [Chthoniobacter sp. 12-60-6]
MLKRLEEGSTRTVTSAEGQPEKYVLMNFEVSWDVMPDVAVEALPEATRERMDELFELVHAKPQKAVQELREMMVLHPEVPCLTNWLINCLRAGTKADRREAMELCQGLFSRMPDYFFARTTLADLWLDERDVDKAAELIFGPGCVLTRLYPERKVFHISEVRHWFYLCARIKILRGEPEIAVGWQLAYGI